MNICMIYMLAVLIALIVGAPITLLLPVLLPAVVSLPEAEAYAPTGGRIEARATARADREARACAPFVKVYAGRGPAAARPAQMPCETRPQGRTLDRHGAALRACRAKAKHVCTSHRGCGRVAS